jgi:hypothetical protein
MSAPDKTAKLNNSDTIRSILQKSNDTLHQAVANNEIAIIAVQNKADKSKFTIVADSVYEKELEGVVLTFANPQDYLRLFPTEPGNGEPPIKCPPNTEYDPVSKKCVPIAPDSYTVLQVVSTPKSQTPQFHENNVLDGKEDTKWAIKQKGASLTLDLGSVVDVGTVWIWWDQGDKRNFYFNIGTSQTEDQDFTNIWTTDKMSSGKVNDFEPYNLVTSTSATPGLKCRFIHITVNGNSANGDWAAISNIKITKNVAVESAEQDIVVTTPPVEEPPVVEPPTTPPVNAEPPKPTEGRPQPEKGADQDANKWKVVQMQKQPELWKVVDAAGINVADQFSKEANADVYVKWYQWKQKQTTPPVIEPPTTEPPTTPPVEQPTTTGSIQLVYPAKQGGQVVSKTEYKRSTHNQSNQSNIPRDSFYSVPKNFFKASNAQIAGYFNVDFQREDELSFKILGGGHGDDNPEAGRCYAIGINMDPGKATVPHIAKEYPKHPTTPKFYNKAKLGEIKTLPDLNNKTFGMRLNYWVTSKNTLAGRVDLDLSVLDKKIADLKECPNKWQTFFTFEDDGSWTGAPYLENQGLKYKDIALGWYIRIDNIQAKTETAFLQGIETAPTGV